MSVAEEISKLEKRLQEEYIEEAKELGEEYGRGLSKEEKRKLKEELEQQDRGERVEGGLSFKQRLRLHGYYRIPLYEEYKLRKDLEVIKRLEEMGVTKITEQSKYLGVSQRKGGRLNRHLRYKSGELEMDEETKEMMESYKGGLTLDEVAEKYKMSKANAGNRLEVMDPEYSYKYGNTSYIILRDTERVKEIAEAIEELGVTDQVKRELNLPNVDIIKIVREECLGDGYANRG